MKSNIFVSYDLHQPVRNYERVIAAIKECGAWAHVQKSFFYVRTQMTTQQVFEYVCAHVDVDDSLIVVNSTTDSARWTSNINPAVGRQMLDRWAA